MTTHFDTQKAYAAQEDGVFFDDGREVELLHFVYSRPNLEQLRGSPQRVLEAIDEYARTKKYLMNVGEDKGRIVTDLIEDTKPDTMVELGGYIGYSALLFGNAVRRAGGRRYWSLERNPEFAAVAASLVSLAGLSDLVQVVVGPSGESLRRLHAQDQLGASGIDMLFLDHYKPAYVADLKLCEQLGLIRPGSVLAADNVVSPGNPPYLHYVRSTVAQKRAAAGSSRAAEAVAFAERTVRQYARREGVEEVKLDESELIGDPALIYESSMRRSFEPTGIPDGVEVTRCVGREGQVRL